MPRKFKWPFRWPWQKAEAEPESATPASAPPEKPPAAEAARTSPAANSVSSGLPPSSPAAPPKPLAAEPVLRATEATPARRDDVPGPTDQPTTRSPQPAPRHTDPRDFELGFELLDKLPALSTPPTLGRQGGLPAMAQALPAVERFMQNLPTPPAAPILEGALTKADEFAAELPSLLSFGGPAPELGAPAFPDTLGSTETQTDVLPPMGTLPGQAATISGQAPVLSPEDVPPREVVRIITEAVRPSEAPPAPGQPVAPPTAPGAPAPQPPVWPMTQVLPVEITLTGNVLPAVEGPPVLRALEPGTPAGLGELAAPVPGLGERVSPEQRTAIESQRGQGAPLTPEVRQRFEAAYGQSLADVRVHTGQAAHSTAESLNAIAFASGKDLFFTQNTFRPDSPQGLNLIGHELAHVVQQQYGVPGDPDALRPADDALERAADQLASAALEHPLAAPAAEPPAGPPVQRAILGTLPAAPTIVQNVYDSAPGELDTRAPNRPLATGAVEDAPVQRFSLGNVANMAQSLAPSLPDLPEVPNELPSLDNAAQRVSGLTDQLPDPRSMVPNLGQMPASLPSLGSLARNLPSTPNLGSLAQNLPGGLPSLDNLPSSPGDLAGLIPGAQNALPAVQNALGGLPTSLPLPQLGGLAQSLPGNLTSMLPSLPGGLPTSLPGGLPEMPQMPTLSGMQLPEMPLAEGLGAASQAAGGALAAGQEALGSITSMAPSAPEAPAAPPLPSLEKLTEHIWKQVQQKLKVERERSRGLA